MNEPLPELVILRISAVISAYMAKGDPHEALGEIIAILEHAGVPWPRSVEDRKSILDAWWRELLAGRR